MASTPLGAGLTDEYETDSSDGEASPFDCSLELLGGRCVRIPDGRTVLGRDGSADVLGVGDASVSARHAAITVNGDGHLALVTDLNSTNRTLLVTKRGKVRARVLLPGRPYQLCDGDTLRLGEMAATFRSRPAPARPESTADTAPPQLDTAPPLPATAAPATPQQAEAPLPATAAPTTPQAETPPARPPLRRSAVPPPGAFAAPIAPQTPPHHRPSLASSVPPSVDLDATLARSPSRRSRSRASSFGSLAATQLLCSAGPAQTTQLLGADGQRPQEPVDLPRTDSADSDAETQRMGPALFRGAREPSPRPSRPAAAPPSLSLRLTPPDSPVPPNPKRPRLDLGTYPRPDLGTAAQHPAAPPAAAAAPPSAGPVAAPAASRAARPAAAPAVVPETGSAKAPAAASAASEDLTEPESPPRRSRAAPPARQRAPLASPKPATRRQRARATVLDDDVSADPDSPVRRPPSGSATEPESPPQKRPPSGSATEPESPPQKRPRQDDAAAKPPARRPKTRTRRTAEAAQGPRILLARRDLGADGRRRVVSMGGVLLTLQDADLCTHLVTEEPTRTVKLLCGMCVASHFVSFDWLKSSIAARKWLAESPYALSGTALERDQRFVFAEVRALPSPRRVFAGKRFVLAPGAQKHGVKEILQCGGGAVVAADERPTGEVLVISGAASTAKGITALTKKLGNGVEVVAAEWVYVAAMRQKIPPTKPHRVDVGR